MSDSVEIQMLNALEFFHYSYRFQHHLFILSLSNEIDFHDIITDLRVLNAAKIRCLVVAPENPKLALILKEWNLRGYPLEFMSHNIDQQLTHQALEDLRNHFEAGRIPVIGLQQSSDQPVSQSILDQFTITAARHFTVDKVFFLSSHEGLQIDDFFVSHLTPQEAKKKLKLGAKINIGSERLVRFVSGNEDFGFEIVLLKGESGCLFQETFTHRGKGTLLTNEYPNIIRRGQMTDVMDIALLLKPYVSSGAILHVSEDDIASEVKEYYVYTVNNSIVAAAKLTDYGQATELAKFCTLPRYQGKGRARELAQMMIDTVKAAKKEYLFALTIEPKMYEFFESLGLKECDRESLPAEWKNRYNMSRKSKAFKLTIDNSPPSE